MKVQLKLSSLTKISHTLLEFGQFQQASENTQTLTIVSCMAGLSRYSRAFAAA
jgi:hypothetical protein